MIASLCTRNMWRAHVSDRRTVEEMYNCLVQKGVLREEPGQRLMVQACTKLANSIKVRESSSGKKGAEPPLAKGSGGKGTFANSGGYSGITSSYARLETCRALAQSLWRAGSHFLRRASPDTVTRDIKVHWPENLGVDKRTGLYLWGDVGIGKTLVMDLFELSEIPHVSKRRVHLHSFMCDLVKRLQKAETELRDHRLRPMDTVVNDILQESPILCLDEFQTIDVTHASLLAGFFSIALPRGLILFATSNRPPQDLTSISDSFARCVPLLWYYCDIVHCENIRDYRENASTGHHDAIFLHPNTIEAAAQLVRRVERGISGSRTWVKGETIWLYGRELVVPYHCGGIALFDFRDICGALGPPDFQCLAKTFHTVIITNIPQISRLNRNAAQQFVILVDELYQFNVKLLFTSEVPWGQLLRDGLGESPSVADSCYSEGEDERSGYAAYYGFRNEEELLSFNRIASRLKEMGCRHYLLRDHNHFVVLDYNFAALLE
ncbi:ATPase [Trypanosoma brucei equiperdum]|uniref:ATPase n=1 Tax=Trypanosoma brucei equiperdum TaxID=630700 RepID=A0A3L6KWC6_9TRYP|nr:ATPase [Trypanosoma brucei equiperdum]